MLKFTTLSFLLLLSGATWSRSLADLKSAKCYGEFESWFNLDVQAQVLRAEFGGVTPINNLYFGEEKTVEIFKDYPTKKFDSIGGLSLGGGMFGYAVLAFTKAQAQNLTETERVMALFKTKPSDNTKQELVCQLSFL